MEKNGKSISLFDERIKTIREEGVLFDEVNKFIKEVKAFCNIIAQFNNRGTVLLFKKYFFIFQYLHFQDGTKKKSGLLFQRT